MGEYRNFDDWSTEAQGLSLTAAGVSTKGRPPAAPWPRFRDCQARGSFWSDLRVSPAVSLLCYWWLCAIGARLGASHTDPAVSNAPADIVDSVSVCSKKMVDKI